eukprot:6917741-Pyramimonas_sp.AAC.1
MHPMNFGASCTWKKHMCSGQQWRRRKADRLHPIFQAFRFLSVLNLEADELHVLWLGVATYFLGSALWLLVFRVLSGSHADNMFDVWSAIQVEGGCTY